MALATLSIDLEARLAKLEGDLGKAARLNERTAKEIADRWESAGASVRAALGAAFAGLSAGAFVAMTRNIIDGLDALNDVADATGASIESISALEDIALRTGTSLDTVEQALVKLNSVLLEAKPGSATESTLKAIGLDAEELRRIDPAEALKKVADALAQYEDDGNKARLAQDLLGKAAKNLAPFLKDLGEAGELNAKATQAQAEQAEQFNKKLAALDANSKQAARAIVSDLIPAFNRLAGELADGMKHYQSFFEYVIDVGTTNPFASINETLTKTATRLRTVSEEMDAIKARQLGGGLFATLNKNADEQYLKRLQEEMDLLKKRQAFFQARQVAEGGAAGAGRGIGYTNPRPSAPEPDADGKGKGGSKTVHEVASEYDKYIAKLEAARTKLEDLSAFQQAVADIEAGRLGKLTEQQADHVLSLAQEIDGMRAAEEAQRAIAKAADDAARSQERMRDEATRLWEAVQTPAEKYAEELANIKRLVDAGAFGDAADPGVAERIGRIQEAAKKRLTDATKGSTEELSEFAKQAQRNIQDALGDSVLSALKGDFSSIEKMWGDLVMRMVAEAAAAQLNEALFGKGGSGGGWISQAIGWAATLFGAGSSGSAVGSGLSAGGGDAAGIGTGLAANGAWFDGGGADFWGGVRKFANGGAFTNSIVSNPTLFRFAQGGGMGLGLMGEAGPEAIMPLARGRDGKLGVRGQGGSGAAMNVTLHLTQQVGEFVTPTQAARLADQTRSAAIAGVADAMRRGRM